MMISCTETCGGGVELEMCSEMAPRYLDFMFVHQNCADRIAVACSDS